MGAYSKPGEKIIDIMPDYKPIAKPGPVRFRDKGELCVRDSETGFLFGIPTHLRPSRSYGASITANLMHSWRCGG